MRRRLGFALACMLASVASTDNAPGSDNGSPCEHTCERASTICSDHVCP